MKPTCMDRLLTGILLNWHIDKCFLKEVNETKFFYGALANWHIV